MKEDINYVYEDFGTFDSVSFALNKLPDSYNLQLDYIKFNDEGVVKSVRSVATGIVGLTLDDIENSINHLIQSGLLDDYYVDLETSYFVDIEKEELEETTFFTEKFSHHFEE